MTRIVGHVAQLHRFPVKSMAGERIAVAEVDWQGIEGDRQYAFFRRANGTRPGGLVARHGGAIDLDLTDLLATAADFAGGNEDILDVLVGLPEVQLQFLDAIVEAADVLYQPHDLFLDEVGLLAHALVAKQRGDHLDRQHQ